MASYGNFMGYSESEEIRNKLLIFGIVVILCISAIIWAISPSQKIECTGDKCSIYRQENIFSFPKLEYTFNPKEIQDYKYKQYYHSRKYGRRYTYSVILNMKDGTKINLDTFEGSKNSQKQMVNDIWNNKTYKNNSRFIFNIF